MNPIGPSPGTYPAAPAPSPQPDTLRLRVTSVDAARTHVSNLHLTDKIDAQCYMAELDECARDGHVDALSVSLVKAQVSERLYGLPLLDLCSDRQAGDYLRTHCHTPARLQRFSSVLQDPQNSDVPLTTIYHLARMAQAHEAMVALYPMLGRPRTPPGLGTAGRWTAFLSEDTVSTIRAADVQTTDPIMPSGNQSSRPGVSQDIGAQPQRLITYVDPEGVSHQLQASNSGALEGAGRHRERSSD